MTLQKGSRNLPNRILKNKMYFSTEILCRFYLVLFPVSWVLFFWLLEGFNPISDIFVLLLIEYSTSVDSTCYWSSNVDQYQLAEFLKSVLCAEHSILILNDTESISWSIFSRSFSTFNSIFIDWEERKKKKNHTSLFYHVLVIIFLGPVCNLLKRPNDSF